MKRVMAGLSIVAVAVCMYAIPAGAKSNKPDGVPTGVWIDFCDHSSALIATLNVIAEDSGTPDAFVDSELTKNERALRRDATKITPKNSSFGKQVLALAKATAKTRTAWDATGKLNLRPLSIAADPLPDCT